MKNEKEKDLSYSKFQKQDLSNVFKISPELQRQINTAMNSNSVPMRDIEEDVLNEIFGDVKL